MYSKEPPPSTSLLMLSTSLQQGPGAAVTVQAGQPAAAPEPPCQSPARGRITRGPRLRAHSLAICSLRLAMINVAPLLMSDLHAS